MKTAVSLSSFSFWTSYWTRTASSGQPRASATCGGKLKVSFWLASEAPRSSPLSSAL
eukprot:CAMPEP_0115125518 /NCGR_PEP_ID=MMETSP0227-20121206/49089_1 /TAXON_ID=89957 /ORGANISM="Polarella glacialis, Strain CCMP 1383" /LENGTH=56 /DNA_ID=CAMNT_0002528903 /DNA_START=155 /DNA_END=322 /DNA_ORIENTATION=-